MKNIVKIFSSDRRRLGTNVVAVIMLIGLTIVPALYAWFNILSNWDPYQPKATSQVKVAVASNDVGFCVEDVWINMGETIMESLAGNTTIGWEFPDTVEEAVDGVYSGKYYAAIIMPEDFSEDMFSFLTQDFIHPKLVYYVNEKKNAIAVKITDKAQTAVARQVNAAMISTIAETVVEKLGTVVDSDIAKALGADENTTLLDVAIEKLETMDEKMEGFLLVIDNFVEIVDSTQSALNTAGSKTELDQTIENSQAGIGAIQDALDSNAGNLFSSSNALSGSLSDVSSLLGSISAAYKSMGGSTAELKETLTEAKTSLLGTKELLADVKVSLEDNLERLYEIRNGEGYQMLLGLLAQDPEKLGEFLSEPVLIETESIYPIANYGSAMAGFYTVLALWVGALILVALLHTHVSMEPEFETANLVERFFGRYLIFYLVGQAQALLTCLGDLYYIGIQCEHPLMLWFACSFTSFVFTAIMYSMTFALENVGQALCVVIMVIQVAGAGGTFPIQVLPKIYQDVSGFLPFPYAMDALKETIGGLYENDYWICLAKLSIFAVCSFAFGIGASIPAKRVNEMVEKSKKSSGIML